MSDETSAVVKPEAQSLSAVQADEGVEIRSHRLNPWRAALRAELLGPFRPQRALGEAQHVPLPIAFMTHALTIVVGIIVFCLYMAGLMTVINFLLERANNNNFFDNLGDLFNDLARSVAQPEFWAALGIFAVIIEGLHLVAAFLLMSFGAVDESVRQSFKNALRTLWLMTSLAFWWSVMFAATLGLMALMLDWYHRRQQVSYGQGPWILQNEEIFPIFGATLATYWLLNALFRGVGARGYKPSTNTTLCETCGYELSHTPMDSRCPECGEPVVESLGPGVRVATPWEWSRSMFSYLRTCADVLVHPGKFYRSLTTQRDFDAARSFAIRNTVAAGVVLLSGAILVEYSTHRRFLPNSDAGMLLIIPLVTAAYMLIMSGLIAGAGGLSASRQAGRNRLAAVGKATCYATALYPALAIVYMLLWVVLLELTRSVKPERGLMPFLRRYGLDRYEQINMLMVTLLIPILYVVVRYHMAAFNRVRYANI